MKLRETTEDDLLNVKYDSDKECEICKLQDIKTIGAYRGSDYYLCKKCFLENVFIDEEQE